MRAVNGINPALAQLSGILKTPPPMMVAVILNVAAITVALRRFESADGTKKATEAIDVA